jgi:4Fe-4S ferredoxin
MSKRGLTQKRTSPKEIILERPMITRHYKMVWDLEKCVGCQIGPLCCPKEAILHVQGTIENGRLTKKPSIDVDSQKCILCGICEVMCPKNAISLEINGQKENPVLVAEAWPVLTQSTIFDKGKFNWTRKDFVIDNCPTDVISEDKKAKTLVVDDEHCIRCRQCEVASNGAFTVVQPWQGGVTLRREKCIEGCFACADICPTRALHINEQNELVLADYYCIKCGACMQVCPIKPIEETYEISFESQGVTKKIPHKKVTNSTELPIWVERWRIRHEPVQSGAWVEGLLKMADERVNMVELDSKRALKRKDLLLALKGSKQVAENE